MRVFFLAVLVFIAGCAETDWTVVGPSGTDGASDTVTHDRATIQEAEAASDTAHPFHQDVVVPHPSLREVDVPHPFQQDKEDWTVLEPTGPGGEDSSVVHERSTREEAEAEAEVSRERDEWEIPMEIPEVSE